MLKSLAANLKMLSYLFHNNAKILSSKHGSWEIE